MNKNEILIDIPEMSDESAFKIFDLFREIGNHFKELHYEQIERYYRKRLEDNYDEF